MKYHVMKKETSAGAVLLISEKEPLYLLLKANTGKHWDFPKGHVEHDENNETTAAREIAEETGITDVKILPDFKETIHYFFKLDGQLISKEVIFFIALTKTREVKLSHEHTEYEWLNYEEALKRITFKNNKDILTKAHSYVKKRGL